MARVVRARRRHYYCDSAWAVEAISEIWAKCNAEDGVEVVKRGYDLRRFPNLSNLFDLASVALTNPRYNTEKISGKWC